jgi:ribosomal protein L1
MNVIEIIPWVVLGFIPTLVTMEVAWRMGKMIGKRGEMPSSKTMEKIKS